MGKGGEGRRTALERTLWQCWRKQWCPCRLKTWRQGVVTHCAGALVTKSSV